MFLHKVVYLLCSDWEGSGVFMVKEKASAIGIKCMHYGSVAKTYLPPFPQLIVLLKPTGHLQNA